MLDRLLIRFYLLFSIVALILVLCGLAFIGMGIARYFGKIDMGASFENIEPVWMVGGGIGMIFAAWIKHSKIKAGVKAAKSRSA